MESKETQTVVAAFFQKPQLSVEPFLKKTRDFLASFGSVADLKP